MAAQKENTQQHFNSAENVFASYSSGMGEQLKEVANWQVRTTQMLMDQTVRSSQAMADFVHNQANEGLKFTQEWMKASWSWADDYRKHVSSLAEKAMHKNH